MKKYLTVPIIATVVMTLWVLKGLVFLPKAGVDKPDIYGFAELPVLLDGRTQPIDSTARNAMRVIRHKSTALRNEGDKEKPYPAVEWLLEVAAKPELARSRPVFRIDNEEVKDHTLYVNVYIPQMGLVAYPLWELLSDPNWNTCVEADGRGMCEVFEDTFLSATIYVALEKMSLCADYF